ncbi:MAG: hypothetical protein AAGC56_04460 [Pseudomonadota bacterium]
MGGILRIIGLIIVMLIAAAVGFYAYLGGFSEVTVSERTFKARDVVVGTHVGPFETLGKSWTAFDDALKARGLAPCNGLALYLDPPGTDKATYRTAIACDLEGVDAETREKLAADFTIASLPEAPAVYATFPYKNMASFFVGPTKAYPKLAAAAATSGQETSISIEVYGVMDEADAIEFYLPLGLTVDAYTDVAAAFEPGA